MNICFAEFSSNCLDKYLQLDITKSQKYCDDENYRKNINLTEKFILVSFNKKYKWKSIKKYITIMNMHVKIIMMIRKIIIKY